MITVKYNTDWQTQLCIPLIIILIVDQRNQTNSNMPKKNTKKSSQPAPRELEQVSKIPVDAILNKAKEISSKALDVVSQRFVEVVVQLSFLVWTYVFKDPVKKYKRMKKTSKLSVSSNGDVNTDAPTTNGHHVPAPADAQNKVLNQRFTDAVESKIGHAILGMLSFVFVAVVMTALLSFVVCWLVLTVFVGSSWSFQLSAVMSAAIAYFVFKDYYPA